MCPPCSWTMIFFFFGGLRRHKYGSRSTGHDQSMGELEGAKTLLKRGDIEDYKTRSMRITKRGRVSERAGGSRDGCRARMHWQITTGRTRSFFVGRPWEERVDFCVDGSSFSKWIFFRYQRKRLSTGFYLIRMAKTGGFTKCWMLKENETIEQYTDNNRLLTHSRGGQK